MFSRTTHVYFLLKVTGGGGPKTWITIEKRWNFLDVEILNVLQVLNHFFAIYKSEFFFIFLTLNRFLALSCLLVFLFDCCKAAKCSIC